MLEKLLQKLYLRSINRPSDDVARAAIDDAITVVSDATGWAPSDVDRWPGIGQLVVVSMALRMTKNPLGLVQETIGEYAARRSAYMASGAPELTPYEAKSLARVSGKRNVSSIGTTRG